MVGVQGLLDRVGNGDILAVLFLTACTVASWSTPSRRLIAELRAGAATSGDGASAVQAPGLPRRYALRGPRRSSARQHRVAGRGRDCPAPASRAMRRDPARTGTRARDPTLRHSSRADPASGVCTGNKGSTDDALGHRALELVVDEVDRVDLARLERREHRRGDAPAFSRSRPSQMPVKSSTIGRLAPAQVLRPLRPIVANLTLAPSACARATCARPRAGCSC